MRCSIACFTWLVSVAGSFYPNFYSWNAVGKLPFLSLERERDRDEERVMLSWLQVTKYRTWTKYVRRKATKFNLTPSLLSHPFVVFLFVQSILDLYGGVPAHTHYTHTHKERERRKKKTKKIMHVTLTLPCISNTIQIFKSLLRGPTIVLSSLLVMTFAHGQGSHEYDIIKIHLALILNFGSVCLYHILLR